MRRVLALINLRSGPRRNLETLTRALQTNWDREEVELYYQFSRNAEDGQSKVRRAIEQQVDTILVAGGDGMINSIGAAMLESGVALGVIPTGSGNGFARHFEIPLRVPEAVEALWTAQPCDIDVGLANGRPFFVTCSLAWDAAIARTFEKSPIRGITPYVFAAAYEFLDYRPQAFEVEFDDGETLRAEAPMVFTAANLTQFGGGAQIAPNACADDGQLELVMVEKKDSAKVLARLPKLFTGQLHDVPAVVSRKFKRMVVRRETAGPVQVDGELVPAVKEMCVEVKPRGLRVLVPEPG